MIILKQITLNLSIICKFKSKIILRNYKKKIKFDNNIQTISAIIGIVFLNLMVSGLDIRSRYYTPGWFLKSKMFYSFGFHAALIPLIYCLFLHGDNFKNKESIYRVQ